MGVMKPSNVDPRSQPLMPQATPEEATLSALHSGHRKLLCLVSKEICPFFSSPLEEARTYYKTTDKYINC